MARPSARIQVRGAKEARRAFGRLEDGLKDLKALHADAAAIVEREAERIVPTVSGALGASIRTSATGRRATIRAGGARVPYAGVIHFGWPGHNIEPQPFLYDAIERRSGDVIVRYARGIDGLLERLDAELPKG
jgi:hypothetical protein